MNPENLRHLSSIHRQQYIERRGWEWKIFLTEVSLLILTMAFIIKEKASLTDAAIYFAIFTVMTAILSVFYLSCIHAASNDDKNFAEEAENCLAMDEEQFEKYFKKHKDIYRAAKERNRNPNDWKLQFIGKRTGTWSFKFQAGIIVTLAVFVATVSFIILN